MGPGSIRRVEHGPQAPPGPEASAGAQLWSSLWLWQIVVSPTRGPHPGATAPGSHCLGPPPVLLRDKGLEQFLSAMDGELLRGSLP